MEIDITEIERQVQIILLNKKNKFKKGDAILRVSPTECNGYWYCSVLTNSSIVNP